MQLVKRLAGTSWGAGKDTLRGLYLGYVRSTLEYGNALLVSCNKSNISTLDKIQNNALRLISGALKTTPTAACEIHCNVEPLETRRVRAALEIFERSKRMENCHPNRLLVDTWHPRTRLKRLSVLKYVDNTKNKFQLPDKQVYKNNKSQ